MFKRLLVAISPGYFIPETESGSEHSSYKLQRSITG